MTACCYILFSEKLNKYYVGSTSDIERRLSDHNRGKEKFTKTGIPWVLVYLKQEEGNNRSKNKKAGNILNR